MSTGPRLLLFLGLFIALAGVPSSSAWGGLPFWGRSAGSCPSCWGD